MMTAGNFKGGRKARCAAICLRTLDQARYLLAYALLRQNKPKDSLKYTRAALQTPTAEQLREVGQDYVLLDDTTDVPASGSYVLSR